jgi:pentapeptide MXKDX repeat protein
VGIVVPVCDEEDLLEISLQAIVAASRPLLAAGHRTGLVVVLDRCRDGSRAVTDAVRQRVAIEDPLLRFSVVAVDAGNVGQARRVGARRLMADFGAVDPTRMWLAGTDADSRVPVDWLTHQVEQYRRGCEGWAGTVMVDDWSERPLALAASFAQRYQLDRLERPHVHGANLGVRGDAYLRAGGHPAIPTGEDHGLWQALLAVGANVVHDLTCPVITSSRCQARAPLGFAHALDQMRTDQMGTDQMKTDQMGTDQIRIDWTGSDRTAKDLIPEVPDAV